jgi:hypothetical protein
MPFIMANARFAVHNILRLWRASGRMTPQYLVTVTGRQMAALRELEHVDEAAAAQVLRMSASTMERILRKHPREAPRRRNRRSGANALASSVPCVPGEALPPAAPGDTQVDTVALCGGDMSGNFFWILTLTDRLTQWTELRCVWNRGAAATKEGLADAEAAFPFPLTAMHSDSGLEFLNAHVLIGGDTHPFRSGSGLRNVARGKRLLDRRQSCRPLQTSGLRIFACPPPPPLSRRIPY